MSILKSILHHYNRTTKSYDTLHPETESSQVTDWHQAVKNSVISEDIKSEILQFQTTLSQETVPSGNTGALTSLLSGIVHQIAALSGKSNWWETPKDSFETLSAGVVAGDVSNPNSWWVKLGGTIPLIIQGGKYFSKNYSNSGSLNECTLPIAFSKPLFAIAISTAMNDDIVPHIHDMSKTAITVSLDLVYNANDGSDADIYLLAVGTV